MKYETTSDRVIVKPAPLEKTTSTGLIMAQSEFDVINRGTVVQIGPGRTTKKNVTIQLEVAIGDCVLFDDGAGIPINIDGNSFLVLKEDEIIGVEE